MPVWRQIRAILLLPGTVTILIPLLATDIGTQVRFGWDMAPPLNWIVTSLGIALCTAGLLLFSRTLQIMVKVGQGTLAPWDPTVNLCVCGPYLRVRNPMMLAVFCILAGESTVLGSGAVLLWSVCFILANGIYIPLVEERDLFRRFGDPYLRYKENVPRWIPRLTPWNSQPENEQS